MKPSKYIVMVLGVLWLIHQYDPILMLHKLYWIVYLNNTLVWIFGVLFFIDLFYQPRIDKSEEGVFIWYGTTYRRCIKIK